MVNKISKIYIIIWAFKDTERKNMLYMCSIFEEFLKGLNNLIIDEIRILTNLFKFLSFARKN